MKVTLAVPVQPVRATPYLLLSERCHVCNALADADLAHSRPEPKAAGAPAGQTGALLRPRRRRGSRRHTNVPRQPSPAGTRAHGVCVPPPDGPGRRSPAPSPSGKTGCRRNASGTPPATSPARWRGRRGAAGRVTGHPGHWHSR